MVNDYLSEFDKEKFKETTEKITESLRGQKGVGTLQEKSLHAVVKAYCQPNEEFHEQRLEGYVADVFDGTSVIEVQTRSFYKLKGKLAAFLPLYPVTVVYPVIRYRYIYRVNKDTGEVSKPRKSPKVGSLHSLFIEAYGLCEFINDPRLKLRVLLIDIDEYRLVSGEKDRGEKGDLMPREIVADYRFDCLEDFAEILPEGLPETFTIEQYKKCGKLNKEAASYEIRVLTRLGVLKEAGREGRNKIWSVTSEY